MSKSEIRGKWALVTWASRGIGRQVSLALANAGCNLVLHSRDVTHTEQLAAELTAKGVQVLQIGAELSDQGQVDTLYRNSFDQDRWGRYSLQQCGGHDPLSQRLAELSGRRFQVEL